jgi:hypothetical protein
MNILLESATRYAERGWKVFPCREKPSNPYIGKAGVESIIPAKAPYTRCGLYDATSDIEQIKKWWDHWKNACIGVSCEPSGLFVIDVDTKHGKDGINIYDIGALQSQTPSSGLHFIWRGFGRSKTDVYGGIDTRGKGGYFIAPPSKIIGVGNYIALNDWSIEPDFIDEKILKKMHVIKESHKTTVAVTREYNQENIQKAKDALDKLSDEFVSSYSNWINVGMSLYSLGNDGFVLWDNWSKNSDKYSASACLTKWTTFKPEEITLQSLFYWADGGF